MGARKFLQPPRQIARRYSFSLEKPKPSTLPSNAQALRPVLDRAKLLVQCRLGTCVDVATQLTKLVVSETELIDSSGPVESSPTLESNESVSPDTSKQPVTSGSNGVEIETLPPSLSPPATHHLGTDSSVRSEK
jgi:hypothetical protein